MLAGGGHTTEDALGEAEEVAEIVQELNHLKTRVARLKLDNKVGGFVGLWVRGLGVDKWADVDVWVCGCVREGGERDNARERASQSQRQIVSRAVVLLAYAAAQPLVLTYFYSNTIATTACPSSVRHLRPLIQSKDRRIAKLEDHIENSAVLNGEGCEECIDKEKRIELLQQELRAVRPVALEKVDRHVSNSIGNATATSPELDILTAVSIKAQISHKSNEFKQRRATSHATGSSKSLVSTTTHRSPKIATRKPPQAAASRRKPPPRPLTNPPSKRHRQLEKHDESKEPPPFLRAPRASVLHAGGTEKSLTVDQPPGDGNGETQDEQPQGRRKSSAVRRASKNDKGEGAGGGGQGGVMGLKATPKAAAALAANPALAKLAGVTNNRNTASSTSMVDAKDAEVTFK